MTLSCIIIDDEAPAREELAFLLSDRDDIRIIGEAGSAAKAVTMIKTRMPDVIFLDIQMPGKSGFDVVAKIKEMTPPPMVIFITAYNQYAVKAFEENAIDYILKPFSQDRLNQSIQRVKNLLALKSSAPQKEQQQAVAETAARLKQIKKISVERRGRLLLLDPDDIIFCQYKDKKIQVQTFEETFTLYGIQTMDQLELHLKAFPFFRSHRNTIINFNCIKEFSPWFHGKYLLTMNDQKKTELTIPRDRVKDFKTLLGI